MTASPGPQRPASGLLGIRWPAKVPIGVFSRLARWSAVSALWGATSVGAEGPGLDSRSYAANQVGTVLSFVDTGAAISAVAMHRGYLIVPMSADHGGGLG